MKRYRIRDVGSDPEKYKPLIGVQAMEDVAAPTARRCTIEYVRANGFGQIIFGCRPSGGGPLFECWRDGLFTLRSLR